MPVKVKKEEGEGEGDGVQVVDNNSDNVAMQIDDDEEDEIVREMDVYLSPQVVHQLYMLQFPLHHLPSGTSSLRGVPSNSSQAPPVAARIKPKHNMLELDHAIPTHCMEQAGLKPLNQRTYASHCVPVTTHLALGKVVAASSNNSNNQVQHELHLAPLHHITQMRPTFGHIDADDPDNSENVKALEEEQAKADAKQQQQQLQQDKERKPLMFQKKESERAANARKNSYAFKKASEEGEPWIDLKVFDLENDDDDDDDDFQMADQGEEDLPSKEELSRLKKLLELPLEFRKHCVVDTAKGENHDVDDDADAAVTISAGGDSKAASSLASYVRSLDYLPAKSSATTPAAPAEEETAPAHLLSLDWKQSGFKVADMDLPTIGAYMTSLLREGWPIPFSILQKTMPPGVPEQDILTALSSCAVLVRGNFVLQSRLMTQLPKPVAKARTFMLLLLQCMGVIHRSRLDYVFGLTNSAVKDNDDDDSDTDDDNFYDESLSAETILMLLELVAKKTPLGWILRGQDDVDFLHRFPETANLHMEYWGRQMLRFQHHLQRYASAST